MRRPMSTINEWYEPSYERLVPSMRARLVENLKHHFNSPYPMVNAVKKTPPPASSRSMYSPLFRFILSEIVSDQRNGID
jgi:hypothetical protein